MAGSAQGQDAQNNGDIHVPGGISQRSGARLVVDRLGDGELGSGLDFALQAAYRLLESVGLGVGVQHHAGVQPGLSRQAHQSKDVHVAHGGRPRSITQGHKITGSGQHRLDAQGPRPPQQPLDAQAVVVAGGAMQDGWSPRPLLDQGTQGQRAQTRFGHRVGGHAKAVKGQGSQRFQSSEDRFGVGASRRHDLDGGHEPSRFR